MDDTGEDVTEAMFLLPESGEVKISITDANGALVRTITRGELDVGSHMVKWDGKNDAGDRVNDGNYRVSVEYASGLRTGQSVNAFSVGKIHSVRFIGGSPVAVIDNQEYYLSDLIEVMESLPEEA